MTDISTRPVQGSMVHLRPLMASDHEWAELFLTSHPLHALQPFRGQVPSPAGLHDALWAGVLTQHVVVANQTGQGCGIVRAHGADPQSRSVYLDVLLRPELAVTGFGLEAWFLLVEHLFEHWPFRTLRMEIPEFAFAPMASADRLLLVDEGRLVEHVWYRGRYWDLLIRSLPRPVWEERRSLFLPRGLITGRGSHFEPPTHG
jgi:RimJ/RimL family protein N-acetyltransferase